LEVTYVANFNGNILRADWMARAEGPYELTGEETMSLLGKFNLVVYLGDGDGLELLRAYAARGASCVALDCYAAKEAAPRVNADNSVRRNGSGGQLCWVEKCSAKEPLTWQKALQLALRQLE
jgi:hypothetical protein